MVEQNVILESHNPYWRSQKTDPDRWPSLVQTLRKLLPGSLRRAGLIIFLLVTISPTLIGRSVRRQLSPFLSSTAAEFENSKGNLLPLPVRVSEQTDALLQQITQAMAWPEGKYEELDTAGKECWILAAITSLNLSYQCPQSESGRDSTALQRPSPTAKLKANQIEALRQLEADVEDFLQVATEEDLQIETKHWRKCLGKRKMDYSDRMVAKAEELSWKRVEPALPREGQSAPVCALQLSEGVMKEFTRNPWESVKPRSDWPKKFKKARSLTKTPDELYRIAQGPHKRNMSRIGEPNEILYDEEGVPLAGALFGVSKDKTLEDDPLLSTLRPILNRVPPNEGQEKIHGDNANLPYYGQWRSMLVRKGDAIYLSSEDMRACFFLFRLPKEWSPFFLVSEPVPGWTHGRPDRTAAGLEGARSSLLYDMIKVEKIVQQLWPEAFIESIWENVASMPEVEPDKSTKLKGSKPLRACPSGHWPMARPRFFWMRDEMESTMI